MINVVRALALTLVVTGAVATTTNSSASDKSVTPTSTRSSMLPKPMCPPDDPNGCGIRD